MFKTIRGKIAVYFSMAIIFTCILFGISGYQILEEYLIQTQQNNQKRLAESLCSSISFFREKCENELNELLSDPALGRYAANMGDTKARAGFEAWIKEFVWENEFVQDMYVIDPAYEIAGAGDASDVRNYLIDRISTAERYEGNVVWDSGYDTKSMILFGKSPARSAGERAAYVFFQIDNSQILEMFNEYRFQNSQRFSLKGETNGFEVTEQGFYYNYYDNYEELLHTELMIDDWKLKTWSDKSLILGPAVDMAVMMLRISFLIFGLGIILSVWIADRITKPIKNMKKTMLRYGEGDLSAKVAVRGKDEIAVLGNILNQMSEQISDLFDRAKSDEEQKRRLELQTMMYQINPHFLYNTLDSVNILARRNKDEQVAEIVTDLSRLFRLGLNQGRNRVTVRDELSHVAYYLKIQKMRFDDQLSWKIEVPSELLDREIIKLILQPIVENAIYHGIKAKNTPGLIVVSAYERGADIVFSIKDTGRGMTQEEIRLLMQRINNKIIDDNGNKGFGLWNVNQRIKLYYGEDYGINIESCPGEGTEVLLFFPSS